MLEAKEPACLARLCSRCAAAEHSSVLTVQRKTGKISVDCAEGCKRCILSNQPAFMVNDLVTLLWPPVEKSGPEPSAHCAHQAQ